MGESKSRKDKVATSQKQESGSRSVSSNSSLTYGKEQIKWMLIGIGFIVLGMILMSGGGMPSPEVWDESLIYSHRRLTLAPIAILIGLGLQIYAIFKVKEE